MIASNLRCSPVTALCVQYYVASIVHSCTPANTKLAGAVGASMFDVVRAKLPSLSKPTLADVAANAKTS